MKNRWLIAAAAVGIHASLGSVYAWSVFKAPFVKTFGWSQVQAGMPFGLAIFVLGTSAAFMGHVVERKGPRFAGLVAAFFWALGLLSCGVVTSHYVQDNHLRMWLLNGSAVVAGIGLGTGYVTPVSTLMKWFPDRRGLAAGLAIMGFGLGALFGAPIMGRLIQTQGIATTFSILAVAYLVIMLASALYLAPPPTGWKPAGFEASVALGKIKAPMEIMPMDANQAIRTWAFYGLWLMMFINITCGIAILSVASPLAQEVTGMNPMAAAALVGAIGLFNGAGRIGWASLSDRLGRPNTFLAFFILQVLLFWLLPSLRQVLLFQIALYLIMTCYGGGFATLPAYIGDIFGTRQVSAIHGYVLTSWAMAGLVGSGVASFLRQSTGSYAMMNRIFAVVFLLATGLSLAMRAYVRRSLKRQADPASLAPAISGEPA
nr:OFA family MFS transporter [uncultured Holophaga sp.]